MPADVDLVLEGLSQLAATLQRPQEPEILALYAERLAPRVEPRDWARAVEDWTLNAPWQHFPPLPVLYAAYQDRVAANDGRRPVEVEAVDAYQRVLDSAGYSPESGARWNYRWVLESCGRAAAEAFLAAGAHEAFATSWNADERRRTFIAAYLEAARDQPETRLLPWKPAALLGAGDAARQEKRYAQLSEHGRELSRADAADALKKLDGAAPPAPPREKRMAPVVNLDQHAEKLARLREQQAALRAEAAKSNHGEAPQGAGGR